MLVDSVAGAFLLAGAVACAVPAVRGRPSRAALALALARRRAGELADVEWAEIVACALATAAIACSCSHGWGRGLASWLDAVMGASATAGLAVALGADTVPAVGAGGVAAGLALCRWRPGRTVLLALAGLAALAAGPWLAPVAALAMAAAAWLPEAPPRPREEFSPIVLVGDPHLRHDRAVPADSRAVHRHRPGGHRARHHHRPGRHGARRADRGGAAARDAHAGADRRPDRSRQPPPPRRHAARHDRVLARARRRARAAADRPRRLQGAQRHARPPRGRRGAAPDRTAAQGAAAGR